MTLQETADLAAPTKMDPVFKGLKNGAIKGGVEKFTAPFSTPVSAAINVKLVEMFPTATITAPMVDSMVKFGVLILLAEVLNLAATSLGSKNVEDPQVLKTKLAAEFLREFAGEQIGVGLVDLVGAIVPVLMTAFKDISIQDLSLVLSDGKQQEQVPAQLEPACSITTPAPVPLLSDEPEMVVVRKRGRPKKKALENPIE